MRLMRIDCIELGKQTGWAEPVVVFTFHDLRCQSSPIMVIGFAPDFAYSGGEVQKYCGVGVPGPPGAVIQPIA